MDTFGRCAVELLTRYHLTVCIEAMSYLVAYGCGCRLDDILVGIVGSEWIHVDGGIDKHRVEFMDVSRVEFGERLSCGDLSLFLFKRFGDSPISSYICSHEE